MPEPLKLEIIVEDAVASVSRLIGPLELGRQKDGEPPPFQTIPATPKTPQRLIIAPQHLKDDISRRHLTLIPLPGGLVRVENHSRAPLGYTGEEAGVIAPDNVAEVAPPFTLDLASEQVRVSASGSSNHGLHSLDEPTRGPASGDLSLSSGSLALLQPVQMRALLEGMPRALGVLQSAVGANDFLERASQALVQIVGLDTGRVLLLKGGTWETAALFGPPPLREWRPSRLVIDRLMATRFAVWQKPQRGSGDPDSASLRLLDTVVAAPLLDRHQQVIGVLYGERHRDSMEAGRGDNRVEAMLIDLLACGVSTGLARLEQEKAALRSATLFEQFFSPELARSLAADPRLLDGRRAAVTVLFADVRSFSRFSEKLGPAVTFDWIGDVLGELSACVQREGGVLVDYIGDELMAMWGAPEEQADQAERAVRAAIAMQAALPALDARWQVALGEGLQVGIGVNSGVAWVGNAGCRVKFKYGPLGNTVNLAARVRGLTKYLRSCILISDGTRSALGEGFITRRVVRTRVVNIESPLDLYEVERTSAPDRAEFFARSQAALDALENREFAKAARAAVALLADHPGDGSQLLTLARATDALVRNGEGFDPVWRPPGK